jgi:Mlc titration factor MtfA (ptsG expression regulator)
MAGLLAKLLGLGSASPVLDEEAWQVVIQRPLFVGLSPEETARLRELAHKLLADKSFSGAGGAEVDAGMATVIAAYAALPVLNLGYGWYAGWVEIVVYPGEFIHDGEETDEIGVVHHMRHQRSGESWEGGPMVLSWQDVEWSGLGEGYNVVIHEFAHKLDMKSGSANGRPPLHPGMKPEEWAHDFQAAYDDFCRRVERDEDTAIDPYAAESPAEFFAVLSEYFFEAPVLLHQTYPAVYGQLQRFYRQDPLARLQSIHSGAAS